MYIVCIPVGVNPSGGAKPIDLTIDYNQLRLVTRGEKTCVSILRLIYCLADAGLARVRRGLSTRQTPSWPLIYLMLNDYYVGYQFF